MSTEVLDVLVVGCGILGASTAYSCSKNNLKTMCIEQYASQTHENGASYGNTRCWRLAYIDKMYINMMQESLKIWKDIEKQCNVKLINHCGGIDFGSKQSKSMKSLQESLTKNNLKYTVLSSKQTNETYPCLKIPDNYISIVIDNKYYGTIDAKKSLDSLVQCSIKNGATFKFNTKVKNVMHDNKSNIFKITTNNSIIYSKHIVFCVGAYTKDIVSNKYFKNMTDFNNKVAGIKNLYNPHPANIVYFTEKNVQNSVKSNAIWKDFPVWAEYNEDDFCEYYGMVSPLHTPFGTLYAMKIGDMPPAWIKNKNKDSVHILKKYMDKRFPKLKEKWEIYLAKKCYMNEVKDGQFVIDKIDKKYNVYIASGSGHAFKHATKIGEYIKDYIKYDVKPPQQFQLTRFKKTHLSKM